MVIKISFDTYEGILPMRHLTPKEEKECNPRLIKAVRDLELYLQAEKYALPDNKILFPFFRVKLGNDVVIFCHN